MHKIIPHNTHLCKYKAQKEMKKKKWARGWIEVVHLEGDD